MPSLSLGNSTCTLELSMARQRLLSASLRAMSAMSETKMHTGGVQAEEAPEKEVNKGRHLA